MKSFIFSILILLNHQVQASTVNFLGSYKVVEYTWCNGPHSGPEPGSCTFDYFENVSVRDISAVTLSKNDISYLLELRDIGGNITSIDLINCNTPVHKFEGCKVNTLEEQDKVTFFIKKWAPGISNRATITFQNNELSVISNDGSYLKFKIALLAE